MSEHACASGHGHTRSDIPYICGRGAGPRRLVSGSSARRHRRRLAGRTCTEPREGDTGVPGLGVVSRVVGRVVLLQRANRPGAGCGIEVDPSPVRISVRHHPTAPPSASCPSVQQQISRARPSATRWRSSGRRASTVANAPDGGPRTKHCGVYTKAKD